MKRIKHADRENWENVFTVSPGKYGDEDLMMDVAGNYHSVQRLVLLDGKPITTPEDCDMSLREWLEDQGIERNSPRVSKMDVITDLSFQEAAKWLCEKLVPEPFGKFLLERL